MAEERLEEAYTRYREHLRSVAQRSIEDARAKLLEAHSRSLERVNAKLDEAVKRFVSSLKG